MNAFQNRHIFIEHEPTALDVEIKTEVGLHTEVLGAEIEHGTGKLIIKCQPWLYVQPIPVLDINGKEVFRLKTNEKGALLLEDIKKALDLGKERVEKLARTACSCHEP